MGDFILALDQGTTSSRAIIFSSRGEIISMARRPFRQIYPRLGWVEHDPLEIWESQKLAAAEALAKSGLKRGAISAIGIANQRETVVVWDKNTGAPVSNAIVWQCRRTADIAERLKSEGRAETVAEKTGLLIDAYFSGTKIKWILDNVPSARARAERGELLCGTIDSWLIWKLTGGRVHVTDCANASRTMLFDIHKMAWDEDLCAMLDVPMSMLPKVVPSSGAYGRVADIPALETIAGLPICGSIGDQSGALFGQGCFDAGDAKNTYGTGCFTLMNLGSAPVRSKAGLLTSVAWSVDGSTAYALEGSVFNGGSAIQWLRDGLGIIKTSHECDTLAETVPDSGGAFVVPAFTGLGAPHWDMYARGCMVGLTRGTTRAHIARATLEGIAFQVADLMNAMRRDAGRELTVLRVDGGACVSDLMMQFQSDLLRIDVDRPAMVETTAFGAAALAGLACGVWRSMDELREVRRSERVFSPVLPQAECEEKYRQWLRAVERSRSWAEN